MIFRFLQLLQNCFFKIPLVKQLKGYKKSDLKADAKAGVNVAWLDFPQGMAYAMIAGLPVQFGIFSSALASITGPIFASSRFIMLGPSNATAVLLLSGFLTLNLPDEQKIAALPLLLIMISLIMFVGAIMRIEVIIQYVSRSVITGYITAAACLIIVNQMPHVLGLKITKSATFGGTFLLIIENISQTNIQTLLFSLSTISIYILLKRYIKQIPTVAGTLLISTLIAIFSKQYGLSLETLPSMKSGSWPISVPIISLELISQLSGTAVAIAFLSLLESSSISKALAARSGDTVNIRQQMCSMGVSSLFNSVGSGMPVSGSLTRSVLNHNSGARSSISSIISGSLLIIGVMTGGHLIGYIPKAVLASLVTMVGISLIKTDTIKVFLTVNRSDAYTFIVTFVAGLFFPLDMAIYLGVGLSIALFLKKVSSPKLIEIHFNKSGELAETIEKKKSAISIVHVEGDLFFGSTDVFLDQMRDIAQSPNIKVIILRILNAHHVDASATMAIKELIQYAMEQDRFVVISGIRDDLAGLLQKAGIYEQLGEENLFHYTAENVTLSTRNALKRAQELIGSEKAEIILYAKEKKEEED